MIGRRRGLILAVALMLAIAGCADDEGASATPAPVPTTTTLLASTPTDVSPPVTDGPAATDAPPGTPGENRSTSTPPETPPAGPALRSLDALPAVITVDGDPSDWADVVGLSVTLEPIVTEADEPIDDREVTIKMAHDDTHMYALFTVVDDYDWDEKDPHLSASPALMFPVDAVPGPHMGADDDEGEHTTGMVDIWHWELDCAAGVESGGAVNPAGGGNPGNDATCNFDDEWATDADTREDDDGAGAENSLLGVWMHTNPVTDGEGVWYFEMSRPLQTGDAGDAQFTVGESTLLALAYWDPDFGPEGWDDSTHVQSSNQGWIQVVVG